MSSVIDELRKVGSGEVVLFFYCKTGDDSTQCAGAVLRNIIAQLYEKTRLLWPEHIEPSTKLLNNARERTLGKTFGKTLGKKESNQGKDGGSSGRDEMELEYAKSVRYLKPILEDFSRLLGRRIFIVVDALDECNDRQSERLVSSLRDLVKETKIKILVASRPEVDLTEDLEGIPKIEVREDNNSKDIKAYLTEELNKLSSCRPKERKIAHREIMKRSAGMFKYANLAIDQLRQPWRRPIKEYLATYPDGLEAFYRQIFQGIKPELRRVLVVTLRWAILAKGDVTPLLVAEDYTGFFESGGDDSDESDEDTGNEDEVDPDDENEDCEHNESRDWADFCGGESKSEGNERNESENRVEATGGEGVVGAANLGNMTSNDGTPEDHTADSETPDEDRGVLDDALRHVKEAGGSVFVNSIARDVPLRLQHSAVKDFVQRESERNTLAHCKTFCPRCSRIEGETALLSVTPKRGHLTISLTICEFTAPTSPGSMILPDWIFKVLTNPGSPPARLVSSYSSELQGLQETLSPCRRDRKR